MSYLSDEKFKRKENLERICKKLEIAIQNNDKDKLITLKMIYENEKSLYKIACDACDREQISNG